MFLLLHCLAVSAQVAQARNMSIREHRHCCMARRYEFYFREAKQYFTNERSKLVKCCFCHEKIKFISSRHGVMFFLLYRQKKDIDKIVDFYSPKQVIVWQRLQDAFKFRREITEISSWA